MPVLNNSLQENPPPGDHGRALNHSPNFRRQERRRNPSCHTSTNAYSVQRQGVQQWKGEPTDGSEQR